MAQLPISSSQSHVLMASPGLPGGMRVNLLANMPSVGVPVKTEPVETQPPAVDLYLCDTSRGEESELKRRGFFWYECCEAR